MTKEIREQVESTKRRLEFVKRHNVGHKILLVKDVQKLLEIVDTQAELVIEWQGIADRQREKLIAKDKQITEMHDALADADVAIEGIMEMKKQITEGREIVEEFYSLNYTHGVDMKRADAWLKVTG